MEMLFIERLGGVAGFGSAGSRLRSRGHIELSTLTLVDREVIDALFAARGDAMPGDHRDAFRYRITRRTPRGEESIEARESAVPLTVCACVRDEIE